MDRALPLFWAVLLIAAAALSLAFAVLRIRRGQLRGLAAAGAVLFRLGLIAVGAAYATGLAPRSAAVLLATLGMVAAGAVLHLAGGLAGRRGGAAGPDDTNA